MFPVDAPGGFPSAAFDWPSDWSPASLAACATLGIERCACDTRDEPQQSSLLQPLPCRANIFHLVTADRIVPSFIGESSKAKIADVLLQADGRRFAADESSSAATNQGVHVVQCCSSPWEPQLANLCLCFSRTLLRVFSMCLTIRRRSVAGHSCLPLAGETVGRCFLAVYWLLTGALP